MNFPIGIIINAFAIVLGGVAGSFAGQRLSEEFKANLNMVFGLCSLAMGASSIALMENMPAVILSVILGTIFGMKICLGKKILASGELMEKGISKIFPSKNAKDENYTNTMITAIVLFCASGTGIYGSITSGMTGDQSILLAKSILDFPTSFIFACVLGMVTCFIAIPQVLIFLALFFLANVIFPLCSPSMIADFKACGGVLLLGTGFRMMKLKDCPIADMIPAMVFVMPISFAWENYILPFVS